MLSAVNNICVESKHLFFVDRGIRPGLKTNLFYVENKSSERLGEVKWFSHWRQYTFDPKPGTTYAASCLIDIAEFCALKTQQHKEAK